MDEQKIRNLLESIVEQGYIGAGPMRLENDPNFIELRKMFATANMPPVPKPVTKKAVKK